MILLRHMGGLGNQLFQYAAAYAMAKDRGADLKVDISLLAPKGDNMPAHYIYREYELNQMFNLEPVFATDQEIKFFNPEPKSIPAKIANRLRQLVAPPALWVESSKGFETKWRNLPRHACIVGNFQSWKYFQGQEEAIRNLFQFRNSFLSQAEKIAKDMSEHESIAIHVRRGDYVDHPIYKNSLGFVGTDYYQEAIRHLTSQMSEDKLANLKAYVFSNTIDWCKEHLGLNIPTVFVEDAKDSGGIYADLQLMTKAQHFIIANSTFSWWGAWLGQKPASVVIAPARWSKDGSLNTTHLLPKNWIKL